MKLSKAQEQVLKDMLRDKWYDFTGYACRSQTLQALERKGFIVSKQVHFYSNYTPIKLTHLFKKIKDV